MNQPLDNHSRQDKSKKSTTLSKEVLKNNLKGQNTPLNIEKIFFLSFKTTKIIDFFARFQACVPFPSCN